MRSPSAPIVKDVVLVGAGHAHVGVLRAFGMQPMPGVRLTLITRQVDTPYSGMLPGMIAGHYSTDQAHIDTGPLCRFANARLYHSEAIGLDLVGKRIFCDNRPPVTYDTLALDIGSTPGAQQVAGVVEHAIPVKPVDSFLARFEAARARIAAAGFKACVGVVGAGPGGVELLLALQHRLMGEARKAGRDPAGLAFAIITPGAEVLPQMPVRMRQRFTAILRERGVAIHAMCKVTAVVPGAAIANGTTRIPLDEIFWTTSAEAAPWLRETGLALDAQGFVRVGQTLQSVSHADVFAVGDVASMDGFSAPKSGVYAVRSGKPLTENIRRLLEGQSLTHHRPQRDALYLISTGDKYVVGTRNGITFEGAWAWTWKDWIDRRFMDRFNRLPEMPDATAAPAHGITVADPAARAELAQATMRCGGCAAKVGESVLSRALAELKPVQRADVVLGLASPDDAAVIDTGAPCLTVQSVDYFRAMLDDPYVFGQIAANHALGDLYAMGAEPQSAMAIATLPYGIAAKVEADLTMLMQGANAVLTRANCALVGGHTSEGAELALGFAVHGLIDRNRVLRKAGLMPGDALILTKPVGTGVLLAADMRAKARARWMMGAIAHMLVPNADASRILLAHEAHAATDVTGFGLAGHLAAMVKGADAHVTLQLDAVPLLDGVTEALQLGILSSLQPANLAARRAIRNLDAAARDSRFPMLFDPQTAGGLLAAVPHVQAEACVVALHAAGYAHAAIIGHVTAGTGGEAVISVETNAP